MARVAAAFGGGGHRNAAGCTLAVDLDTARHELVAVALQHVDTGVASGEA